MALKKAGGWCLLSPADHAKRLGVLRLALEERRLARLARMWTRQSTKWPGRALRQAGREHFHTGAPQSSATWTGWPRFGSWCLGGDNTECSGGECRPPPWSIRAQRRIWAPIVLQCCTAAEEMRRKPLVFRFECGQLFSLGPLSWWGKSRACLLVWSIFVELGPFFRFYILRMILGWKLHLIICP